MKRFLGQRKCMRLYIGNEDTWHGKPLWETLIKKAQEMGLKGATVFKGTAGFGAHSEIHTFSVWILKQKLPLVIEMVEEEDKIRDFLNATSDMIEEGFVTRSDVEVIAYKQPKNGNPA